MGKHTILAGLLLSVCGVAQVSISFSSKFSGTAKSGSKGELEVKVQKKNINSFAKYQVEFPLGVSFSEIDSKGGNFSLEGNKAKIVWVNLPPESEFVIKLKIYFDEQVVFPVTLYQKFYYLENSIKKEVQANPLIINASENTIAYINSAQNQSPSEKSIIAASITSSEKNEEVSEIKKEKKNNSHQNYTMPKETKSNSSLSETTPSTTSTVPNDAYTYKIQVAASVVKPDESTYSNLGKVEIIHHKGMYKVMIDKTFMSKEQALKYREEVIQKGYTGAFLVKYLNGQRVN